MTSMIPNEHQCPSCGAPVEPGDLFCVACGARLAAPVPGAQPASRGRAPGRAVVLVAGVVATVVVVVAAGLVLLGGDDGDSPGASDATPINPGPTQPPPTPSTPGPTATASQGASSTSTVAPGTATPSPSPAASSTPSTQTVTATASSGPTSATPSLTPSRTPTPQHTPTPTKTVAPTATKTVAATATWTPIATSTPTTPASGTLSGVLYLDTGSGSLSLATDYPIRFAGAGGTFDLYTGGSGQFSLNLPYGTYQVSDGYAGFGCAAPPEVSPSSVTISAPAQQQQLITTGCVLF